MLEVLKKLRTPRRRPFDLGAQAQAYRAMPPAVLADLADFCGATDPAPAEGDLFKQGRAAGRRDVWLRIVAHRHLREEEVFALLKGEPIATALERYHG